MAILTSADARAYLVARPRLMDVVAADHLRSQTDVGGEAQSEIIPARLPLAPLRFVEGEP
jgi:hypothetical protein